jgi:lysophospholipase L1-like esterase
MNQIKKILCYGDSNTFGFRPDNSGRYNRFTRWTGILQNKLGTGYSIIEDGSCGRTTVHDDLTRPYKNGKEFLLPSIKFHKPIDLILLMLGTNDLKTVYHPSADKVGSGIEVLLDIIEKNPASNNGSIPGILLISPIHLKDEVWKEELDLAFDAESVKISKQLEDTYRKIAAKHKCHFFSASSVSEASSLDAEHLDDAGHLQLANALYPKVISILS